MIKRLTWRVATVTEIRQETPTARTLVFDVPGWPGHLPGQHVDVKLTADDGYSAQRSYSIANGDDGERVELTVQQVSDGEVSPYLTEVLEVGDQIELRGPVGGWFVWRPHSSPPVLLVGGGSGIVPLMAMIRSRGKSDTPFRLLYSLRDPGQLYYAGELEKVMAGVEVAYLYTRTAPPDAGRAPGRIRAADLVAYGWPPETAPDVFVCGPTGFVEAAADLLTELGHDPAKIKTERFGPTGG
ncbi:ferredoxin reductase [Herbidospora sp. NBRC 101105]|uniref:ferredoxin reductase n=1 Tax=Herbidospora sp. NBRC 101105 TaxID=3032195 RepID=UPI0024A3C858|nr:ferredoxin reductase [Herbidospora sp. NBRC 101105]GLX98673.1 oxidoreductase [Herbidospora sp. NBRC 101105]